MCDLAAVGVRFICFAEGTVWSVPSPWVLESQTFTKICNYRDTCLPLFFLSGQNCFLVKILGSAVTGSCVPWVGPDAVPDFFFSSIVGWRHGRVCGLSTAPQGLQGSSRPVHRHLCSEQTWGINRYALGNQSSENSRYKSQLGFTPASASDQILWSDCH